MQFIEKTHSKRVELSTTSCGIKYSCSHKLREQEVYIKIGTFNKFSVNQLTGSYLVPVNRL